MLVGGSKKNEIKKYYNQREYEICNHTKNGEKCQKLFCGNDKKNPDGGGGSLPYFQTEPVPIIILCVIIIIMMMMVSHILASKNDI